MSNETNVAKASIENDALCERVAVTGYDGVRDGDIFEYPSGGTLVIQQRVRHFSECQILGRALGYVLRERRQGE